MSFSRYSAVIAERGAGLAARQAEQAVELLLVVDALDPAAPSPARRLDQQRVADLVGQLRGPPAALATSPPGSTGAPALAASARAASLSPASFIALVGGPTKVSPCSRARSASAGLSDRKP